MKLNKVYIEITNRCNLSCSFCSQSKLKKQDIRVEAFEHIINEVKLVTHNIYLHVKGEPLFHPELQSILKVCEAHQMRVNITSNGTLIKQNFEMLHAFSCIKKINFSLHCEQYNPTYFEDIFECAETLKQGRTIIYRLWTMRAGKLDEKAHETIDAMVKFYKLANEKKEEIIHSDNIKIGDNIYVDKDNEFVWPSMENEDKREVGYCYALRTHLAILVNGDVVPCCLDGEGIIHLGNIHTQSLQDIIQSERYQKLKKSFQDRKPCEELCQRCGFKNKFK